MTVSESDVLHVARLARLELQPSEVTQLAGELAAILSYFEELDRLDTSSVEPTLEGTGRSLPLAEDCKHPGLSSERALGEAPRATDGGFAVPGFVEE